MAESPMCFRPPGALRALIEGRAAQTGESVSEVLIDVLTVGLTGMETEPRPAVQAPPLAKAPAKGRTKGKAKAALAKAVAPLPPVERRAEVAKEALAGAEARTGVQSVMDSLPLGNTRAPMLRARDRKGRGEA